MKHRNTVYVTHPVPSGLKAKFRSEGLRILDARFAPTGAEIIDPSLLPEYRNDTVAAASGNETGAGESGDAAVGSTGPITRDGIADMSKEDVVDLLEFHQAEFDGRWGVERLREVLIATMFVDA